MISRERVRKAINHQQPDRIPFDLGSTSVTGIHVNTYAKLKSALGIRGGEIRVYDPFQMLAEVEDSVKKLLGIDTFGIPTPYTIFGFRNENWKPWRTFQGTDVMVSGHCELGVDNQGNLVIYPQGDRSARPSGRMPKGGFYFDNIIRQAPFKEEDLDPKEWVEETYALYKDEDLNYLENLSSWAYIETEYSIIGNFCDGGLGDIAVVPGPHVANPRGIRDPQEWLLSLATRKSYIKEIFAYQTEMVLKNLKMYHEAVGDRIDIIDVSETDLGVQTGLLLSKETFRELFKPYYKKMNEWIHRNTNWKTFYHSCGSIVDLLGDLIDAGVDIINPVQYSAEGMEPSLLKHTYGDRITFWGGGVDAQRILPFGSPEEVKAEAIKNMRTWYRDGGFVFGSIHNVQPDVPINNLKAMIDTFNTWRDCSKLMKEDQGER